MRKRVKRRIEREQDSWLGIPGLRRDLPIDELMDALALDVLQPLPFVDPRIDPVKYEVAVHRITASLREGAWALVRTSSSPLVTECGEYMFAIYDSEGHSAYVTAGVLPQGARFIGFRYEAEDSSGKGDCFGEEPCAIGQARWTTNPRIERTATVTVIHSSFVNESTSVERRARMTIYFQPPRGWRPPG